MRGTTLVAAFVAVILPSVRAATAAPLEIPCDPVEQDVIALDGLLGDWGGVKPVRVGEHDAPGETRAARAQRARARPARDRDDLSFWVKCNYRVAPEARALPAARRGTLYLALRVRDDRVVFRNSGRRGDHLELRFGQKQLTLFPSDLKQVRQRLLWGGRPARGFEAAEALQTDGYSVELALPLAEVPGFREGVLGVPVSVTVFDADRRSGEIESRLAGAGKLVFAQARADIDAFLEAVNAAGKPIRFRRSGDVYGDARLEQVLLVGRTLGIVGQGMPEGGFYYVELPARSADHVRWIRLVELNGDGKLEIVVRYVEHAANGRREIVELYRFNSAGKLVRPFAHEVLKGQGSRVLTNRVRFAKRRGARGLDLVIDRPAARGFDARNYREERSTSIYPILLPWDEPKQQTFRFEGDVFSVR